MNTYGFCTDWIARHVGTGKVLDYGCGRGEIVERLRGRGIDARGVDVFYGGYGHAFDDAAPFPEYIQRFDGSNIPYPDDSFDIVLSNQVLEHVSSLETVVSEMSRVLKPDGICLNVFPDRSVWREGHCGVPFIHRFARNELRVYYAMLWRSLGFGYWHKGKPVKQWAKDFCEWLDDYTFYRPIEEIHSTFNKFFLSTKHIEEEWFLARFGSSFMLPILAQRVIVKKAAGIALMSTGKIARTPDRQDSSLSHLRHSR